MIKIYIANLGKYNEGCMVGEWFELPYSGEEWDKLLKDIDINKKYEEFFIADVDCEISSISKSISEYSNITELNELAERLESLEKWEVDKFSAITESEHYSIEDLVNITYNLDCWELYPDVKDDEDLGEYFFYELQAIEISDKVVGYFNFERYGSDIHLNSWSGSYTTYGYICQVSNMR
ncbi:MAG: antirestriction protein ArdA [Saprospiraceae bacterium]|nr:antirestriction protein ArdA [Saprospiraceae bacterium]